MASITNVDGNVSFCIALGNISEKAKNEYETWLSAELSICSETINITIGDDAGFMLNLFEAKELLNCLQALINANTTGEKSRKLFCNIESNFEMRIEAVPEDKVVEIEIWINTASRTLGKVFGYDEGIRFVSTMKKFEDFAERYKEELKRIIREY